MLHKLEPILDHPTYQMQEILSIVVNAAVDSIPFDSNCFTESLREDWDENWEDNDGFIKKLHDQLYQYVIALSDKNTFKDQFQNNNNIQALCNDVSIDIVNNINWEDAEDLNKFFLSCYSSLDLVMYRLGTAIEKPRKEYDVLFRNKNKYVCPFCGLNEYVNVKAIQRADFDHYIYKGDYPLASANMANLIPMCTECNRDVKKAKNILLDGNDRTYAFYPYDDIPEINFEVLCSREPGKDLTDQGVWDVNITPSISDALVEKKIETWIRVFDIKQRYINDIEEFHDSWVLSLLDGKTERFEDITALKSCFQAEVSRLQRTLLRKMEQKVYIKIIFFKFMYTNASNKFLDRFLKSHNNSI